MENFTKEQVLLVLKALYIRLQKDPASFTKKIDSTSVIYHRFGLDPIYVSIGKNVNMVHLSLGEKSSCVWYSNLFWKDKELKSIVEQLKNFSKSGSETSEDLILKYFPEIVDSEFENKFLTPNK